MRKALTQTWWAPLAGLLVVLQVWVALGFLFGEGDFGIRDWKSTIVGTTFAVAGAAALLVGLWKRPTAHGVGNALILVGAALAAMWFWAVAMTPLAIVVIVGLVVGEVRKPATPIRTTRVLIGAAVIVGVVGAVGAVQFGLVGM